MNFIDTPVTLLLLVLNVMVSLFGLFQDPGLIGRLAFKPRRILEHGEYHRLVTAGFVHAGLGHLLFNMMTLYFFGPLLELRLGPAKFLVLYFGAELAAHGLSLVMNRHRAEYAAIGASGAISGVLFGFCLFRPFDMLFIFGVLPMPAILFAVVYVALSVYAMRQGQEGRVAGGIAHEAHLGGALGGLVLTMLLEPASLGIFLAHFGLN